ncbi:MAG: MBL fold metallo-hydrolase [Pseudomonadota bacterium]
MTTLSRRAALTGGAALPLAATTLALPAAADGHAEIPARSDTHRRFTLGDFEVTTLLAGTRLVEDDPQGIFGMNIDKDTFVAASEANFIPADKVQFFFNPVVVKTGSETILFDTGFNGPGITGVLASAGIAADEITHVVITHMHGDHIGGLTGDNGATFANAAYVTGQVEFDAWAAQDNEGFEAKVRPLAEQMTFIGDGGSVASGVTGLAAFGHTPGHMVYMLESGGKQLVITADTANHYVWSLAYPDWEVRFDMDKAGAAEARRKVFGMIAADKIPFIGYHMPFPGAGFVEANGDGFRYVPETYQLML